jgi:DNA-binding transcriptional LysR family regulator
MLDVVKNGLVIGFILDFVCREVIAKGEVVEMLTKFKKPQVTLYVLYPVRQFMSLKLQHCISFFEEWF